MKKILKKVNALLSCVLALTLVLGFFSTIRVKADDGTVKTIGDGKIRIKVHVTDNEDNSVEGANVKLCFVDFGGEVEDVLADGWNAIVDKLNIKGDTFKWLSDHEMTAEAKTNGQGIASFNLDSGIDYVFYYKVDGKEGEYKSSCYCIDYLRGRVGIVIKGYYQVIKNIEVTVNPDGQGDDGSGGTQAGGTQAGGTQAGGTQTGGTQAGETQPGETPPGGNVVLPGSGSEVPGGNGTVNPNGPSSPTESSWGEILEPDTEEVEPEIFDIIDNDGQALGDAVSKDPQVVEYDGGSEKKAKKDNGTKLVAKADTTPSANTDDTQYADIDGDDTARGNTDIPEDEAKEEKETVNFVAKVDDTKKDDAPAVAPATTEVKEEVSNPITELATQAGEGVSLKFWLLWIIIGVVLVGGGVTIYLKRRR